MHIALFTKRSAGYSAVVNYFFLFLVCSIVLASCFGGERIAEGSFDGSNERESGPSKRINSMDYGWNIMLESQWGMIGVNPKITSAGTRDWLPYDYEPAPASGGSFKIDAGLELVRKGSKIENTATHLTYLNLFGDVLYNYQPGSGGTFFGGLGPYIGYGLGGSVSGDGFSEAAFGGADGGYKRFDAGVHLKGGYQLPSSLRFSLAYEYGLVNKSPAPDFTSRNRTVQLNVGYSLDKIIGVFKRK